MVSGSGGPERRVRDVVADVVAAAGFDLEELTVVPAGRRRLLRVVVDSDTGVDLDAAAEVSRNLSQALDTSTDPMGEQPYTLEVTSPGIGRPLTAPRHFRRAAGRLVALSTVAGEAVTGRVRQATDDRVELLGGKDGLQPRWLELADIQRARVEVEFSAPSAAVLAALGAAAEPLTADTAGWDPDQDPDPDTQEPDAQDEPEEEGEQS